MYSWYSWISKFLRYSTLKSIISKHGGDFSFRYFSFISDDFFHVLCIRRHFQDISQASTQKDWPQHFSKAFKFFIILFLVDFGGKGIGFLTHGSLSLPCFLATKSLLSYLLFLGCRLSGPTT